MPPLFRGREPGRACGDPSLWGPWAWQGDEQGPASLCPALWRLPPPSQWTRGPAGEVALREGSGGTGAGFGGCPWQQGLSPPTTATASQRKRMPQNVRGWRPHRLGRGQVALVAGEGRTPRGGPRGLTQRRPRAGQEAARPRGQCCWGTERREVRRIRTRTFQKQVPGHRGNALCLSAGLVYVDV